MQNRRKLTKELIELLTVNDGAEYMNTDTKEHVELTLKYLIDVVQSGDYNEVVDVEVLRHAEDTKGY